MSAILPKSVALPYSRFLALRRVFGMPIHYIHPGEPSLNAYIERFNRGGLNEVLDLYIFNDIEEVRGKHIGGWLHTTNYCHGICWMT
ncbi:MAG: transposase [Desulfobulbaceae bacterium]|nr:transposase [Desulfobulbaceae bacterium]